MSVFFCLIGLAFTASNFFFGMINNDHDEKIKSLKYAIFFTFFDYDKFCFRQNIIRRIYVYN